MVRRIDLWYDCHSFDSHNMVYEQIERSNKGMKVMGEYSLSIVAGHKIAVVGWLESESLKKERPE